jgi:hypothetical protein
MSAYGLMMDAIHSGQLSEQAETIEDLNKKCDLLYEWIQYLNGEIERLKNGECKERESQTLSPVVETSTGLEASVLENRTKCTEKGYCKKD